MFARSMRNSSLILHGDRTISDENFKGSTTPTALAKNICDTNAEAPPLCRS